MAKETSRNLTIMAEGEGQASSFFTGGRRERESGSGEVSQFKNHQF